MELKNETMISLADLLPSITFPQQNLADLPVRGVTQDSRSVSEGCLFLAVPGLQSDGRKYIQMAIEKGACAVLYQTGSDYSLPDDYQNASIPIIGISELQTKIGLIAAHFYQHPSEAMTMVGVTGPMAKLRLPNLLRRF